MAVNTIKVLTFIANEMMRQVKNNLQFVKNCSGEDLASRFTDSPKKGESIKVRKHARFSGRDGETYTEESYIEREVDVTVQTTAGVDITLTNRELMFSMDQIAERVVKPAAETLANKVDRAALLIATKKVFNFVGVPGTVPTALKTYNQARALMSNEGAPQDGHVMLITPDMQVEAVDASKALFHADSEINRGFETGLLGRHAGAKVYECQNLIGNTVGVLGGTPAVSADAAQVGTSLATVGWTAAAVKRMLAGNIIEIAGHYAVNPWTKESTGSLRKYVLTADFTCAADGTGNLSIAGVDGQGIITSGPYQNCTGSPAAGALISVYGKAQADQAAIASKVSPCGLRFHPDAFIFGTLDQPRPERAVEFCKMVSDAQTGMKIRYIRDWNTEGNKQLNRFDCVWYFGVAFPEFAARIQS